MNDRSHKLYSTVKFRFRIGTGWDPPQAFVSGGRRYGGGLNKIEPNELENIHLSIEGMHIEARKRAEQLALL